MSARVETIIYLLITKMCVQCMHIFKSVVTVITALKKVTEGERRDFQCQGYICFKLESDEDRLL